MATLDSLYTSSAINCIHENLFDLSLGVESVMINSTELTWGIVGVSSRTSEKILNNTKYPHHRDNNHGEEGGIIGNKQFQGSYLSRMELRTRH